MLLQQAILGERSGARTNYMQSVIVVNKFARCLERLYGKVFLCGNTSKDLPSSKTNSENELSLPCIFWVPCKFAGVVGLGGLGMQLMELS